MGLTTNWFNSSIAHQHHRSSEHVFGSRPTARALNMHNTGFREAPHGSTNKGLFEVQRPLS